MHRRNSAIMKRHKLFDQLSQLDGITFSEGGWLSYRGAQIWLDVPQLSHLLVVVPSAPRQRLLISPVSAVTKEFDALGLSGRFSTGLKEFDDKFVVRSQSCEEEARALVADVVEPLKRLEPLIELELTSREYRLLKPPTESAIHVREAFDALLDIVSKTRARVPEPH